MCKCWFVLSNSACLIIFLVFFVCVFDRNSCWALSGARVHFKLIFILMLCAGDREYISVRRNTLTEKTQGQNNIYLHYISTWQDFMRFTKLKRLFNNEIWEGLVWFVSSNLTGLLCGCLNVFVSVKSVVV